MAEYSEELNKIRKGTESADRHAGSALEIFTVSELQRLLRKLRFHFCVQLSSRARFDLIEPASISESIPQTPHCAPISSSSERRAESEGRGAPIHFPAALVLRKTSAQTRARGGAS